MNLRQIEVASQVEQGGLLDGIAHSRTLHQAMRDVGLARGAIAGLRAANEHARDDARKVDRAASVQKLLWHYISSSKAKPSVDKALPSPRLGNQRRIDKLGLGQLRAGAHTDYGSLTIVAPTPAAGRLQVKTCNGVWAEIEPGPGEFVVNIGDLMAQWTNNRWVSTLHRVGNPAPAEACNSRRLSLVFFHQPNDDAMIECIPTCLASGATPSFAPVTSGEHLRMKINRTFAAPGMPQSQMPERAVSSIDEVK